MEPDYVGYDVIVKDPLGWNGQRELLEEDARLGLQHLLKFIDARAWWIVRVDTEEVLVQGGEAIGHHPSEYGWTKEDGLLGLIYK